MLTRRDIPVSPLLGPSALFPRVTQPSLLFFTSLITARQTGTWCHFEITPHASSHFFAVTSTNRAINYATNCTPTHRHRIRRPSHWKLGGTSLLGTLPLNATACVMNRECAACRETRLIGRHNRGMLELGAYACGGVGSGVKKGARVTLREGIQRRCTSTT